MKTLEMSTDSVREVRLAWMKSRSVAAENGYLDLMGTKPGEGLDWVIGNEQTLTMLERLESGDLPLDEHTWSRVVWLLEQSPSLSMSLVFRGFGVPEEA